MAILSVTENYRLSFLETLELHYWQQHESFSILPLRMKSCSGTWIFFHFVTKLFREAICPAPQFDLVFCRATSALGQISVDLNGRPALGRLLGEACGQCPRKGWIAGGKNATALLGNPLPLPRGKQLPEVPTAPPQLSGVSSRRYFAEVPTQGDKALLHLQQDLHRGTSPAHQQVQCGPHWPEGTCDRQSMAFSSTAWLLVLSPALWPASPG